MSLVSLKLFVSKSNSTFSKISAVEKRLGSPEEEEDGGVSTKKKEIIE
jgi:hypothetical protein